jgi:dTDP-4-amino-4,6-dideoxygalactose transaminase
MTTSCTDALEMSSILIDVKAGDEVIVPAFTWVSTANAAIYCGAKPVFVDIDATFNLDPAKVADAVTSRTKAVLAVHLFGLCADIDAIRAAVPDRVVIVEDAACAAGAVYRGRPAGTLGAIAAFSFHPRKSITTGEGGMVTTADGSMADAVRVLRNHGQGAPLGTQPHDMAPVDVVGFNYRLTDIQAAIGLVQLTKLDRFITERSASAAFYREALGPLNWIHLPAEPAGDVHAWQSYVVQLDPASAPVTRNDLARQLAGAGIGTRPGTQAVHMLDYYRRMFDLRPDDFPRARAAAEHSLSIPLHNRMSADDYSYVAETILRLARR